MYKEYINEGLSVKVCAGCVAVLVLFGFTPVSYADSDTSKNFTVPPVQFHDYSFELKSDKSASVAPTAPAGLAGVTRETRRPFLGLSLTKPFPN